MPNEVVVLFAFAA